MLKDVTWTTAERTVIEKKHVRVVKPETWIAGGLFDCDGFQMEIKKWVHKSGLCA